MKELINSIRNNEFIFSMSERSSQLLMSELNLIETSDDIKSIGDVYQYFNDLLIDEVDEERITSNEAFDIITIITLAHRSMAR